jgi:hypothetical protein
MHLLTQGIKNTGYQLAKKVFLVEYFNVAKANKVLSLSQRQILITPIKTESLRLSLKDQEKGLLTLKGHPLSRVTLYDLGTELHLEGNVYI